MVVNGPQQWRPDTVIRPPRVARTPGPLLLGGESGGPLPASAPAARLTPTGAATARSAEIAAITTPCAAGGVALTALDYEQAAQQLGSGIPAALVRAFAEVESGGRRGFNAARLPVIAFEGHRFRRYTGARFDRSHPLMSYRYVSKAGWQWRRNNRNQTAAWATLRGAMRLDLEAALKACSWGMFQIMGDNHAACGYKTVRAFVDAMKAGERGQLDAFVGFCKQRSGMVQAMRDRDYAAMATKYNGQDYGDYDWKIRKAFHKHGGAP